MPGYRLTRAARGDLRDIGRFTHAQWGREQRDKYLGDLCARFEHLSANPDSGSAIDNIKPGYRRARQGRHVIFFRSLPNGIEIVRVLHDSMDFHRHLVSDESL